MKYGRLTLIGGAGKVADKHEFLCDCGNKALIRLYSVKSGSTQSCGCLAKESASKRFRKHYGKGTTEYASWQLMKDRCYNKNNKTFSYYGEKGITVCDEWIYDFPLFLSDMGPKGDPLNSIDRIDGSKGYSKDNCRWATKTEQARNRSNTKIVEYLGKNKPLAEWCEILNLDYNNTNKRLWRGWSVVRAFTERKKS